MRSNKRFNFPKCVNLIFFMRNPLAKFSARSISIKFWTTTEQPIHWFSLLRKPFLRAFFGSLKTSEKLSFFKNQKDEKVPGFPFPSAIGGCPTTFSRLASVAGIYLSTLNQDKPKRGRTLLLTYKKSESKRPRQ